MLIFLFQNCSSGFESLKSNQNQSSSAADSEGVGAEPECRFNGAVVQNGNSVVAFELSTVPGGQACVSENRTCAQGSLSGSFTFASCSVGAPAACLFNGVTVASGQSSVAYQSSTVPSGQTCVSENRICTNGNLSGTFDFSNCAVDAPAACTFNGQTLQSGQSTVAYQTATVAFGQTCAMQTRSCNNGVLNGSFGFNSCVVAARPPIRKVSVGASHACALVGDKLKCWGQSSYSKFADGLTDFGTTLQPREVRTGVTDFSTDSFGWECNIVRGALMCTGGLWNNPDNLLPNGPIRTVSLATSGASQVAVTHDRACGVVNNRLLCWYLDGPRSPAPIGVEVAIGDTQISDLATSLSKSCAVVSNGGVRCWDFVFSFSPVINLVRASNPISVINSGATKVAIGQTGGVCAVVQNNLMCWGQEYARTDGTFGRGDIPELVLSGVVDVSMANNGGISETCAVRTDGAVQCWGGLPGDVIPPMRTLISSGAASVHILSYAQTFIAVQMQDGSVMSASTSRGTFGPFTRVNLD